jgi:hypothetical protein
MEEAKQDIYKLIIEFHDPSLVKPLEQPNGNLIYHLYNDGEITQQKGGYAYKQRTEFTMEMPIKNILDPNNFPMKVNDFGYAIMTNQNALIIRNLMMGL